MNRRTKRLNLSARQRVLVAYSGLSLRRSLGLLLSFLVCQSALAQSSVWKAEKNGRHIYLGGTLHLLNKTDYPLPGEFDLAYAQSHSVYFETDIEKLKGAEFSGAMVKALRSKDNKTLSQTLKADTLLALKAYLKVRNLRFERFNRYSPSGAYLALMSLALTQSNSVSVGVDAHFAKRARLDRKAQYAFETIEQHLEFLSKLAGDNADQLILNGLQDTHNASSMIGALKRIWRAGDREQYRRWVLNPYKTHYPTAYRVLLVQRNDVWMPSIEAMLQTPEVEFVLVGAMHLVGERGILQRLEAKGYSVEPF